MALLPSSQLVCLSAKFENHKLSAMWVGCLALGWVSPSCRILFISLRPRAHNRNVNGNAEQESQPEPQHVCVCVSVDRSVSYTASVCLEALANRTNMARTTTRQPTDPPTHRPTSPFDHLGANHKRIVQVFRSICEVCVEGCGSTGKSCCSFGVRSTCGLSVM